MVPRSSRRWLGRTARALTAPLLTAWFAVLGAGDRLRRYRQRRLVPAGGGPRRILLLRFGLLGDALLWVPALQAARRLFPTARLEAVVTPYQHSVLARFPHLDELIVWDTAPFTRPGAWLSPRTWRSFAALVRHLRARRYDLVVSCYGRMGARLALLSGAPVRIGYRDEGDPLAFTHPLPGGRYQRREHETIYNLRVVRAAASAVGALATTGQSSGHARTTRPIPAEAMPHLIAPGPLEFPITAAECQRAQALLAAVPAGAPLVGIHPGASNGAAKRWLPDRWAALADALSDDGVRVVLLGGADDDVLVSQISSQLRRPALRLEGQTRTPGELAAVLARCHVVAAGDTGPMHLAVAAGRPVVAIHGPTDPAVSGPTPGAAARVVRVPIPCSPCYDLRVPADCPLGHTLCMRLLPVEEVLAAIRVFLKSDPAVRSALASQPPS